MIEQVHHEHEQNHSRPVVIVNTPEGENVLAASPDDRYRHADTDEGFARNEYRHKEDAAASTRLAGLFRFIGAARNPGHETAEKNRDG